MMELRRDDKMNWWKNCNSRRDFRVIIGIIIFVFYETNITERKGDTIKRKKVIEGEIKWTRF